MKKPKPKTEKPKTEKQLKMIAFWKEVSPAKRDAIHRLQIAKEHIAPDRAVKDLPCPDCGRHMTLRDGTFGRFYLCRKCGRTVSAKLDGTPPKKYYDPLRVKMNAMDDALGDPHGS
jgi:predicted RNA-binding Zn-ribbon protein involved in translation (DUF1610 family)